MKKKFKAFKIGRDNNARGGSYVISPDDIVSTPNGKIYFGEVTVCSNEFHRLTRCRLKPGRIGTFKLTQVK